MTVALRLVLKDKAVPLLVVAVAGQKILDLGVRRVVIVRDGDGRGGGRLHPFTPQRALKVLPSLFVWGPRVAHFFVVFVA